MATYFDSVNPNLSTSQRDPARARVKLRALLICDLVDSTALVDTLGDAAATELIRRHDRIARDLFQRHAGQEIDKSDGFLALFQKPESAIGFALDYQRALRDLTTPADWPLSARVGIHFGEIVLYENTREDVSKGAKPIEAEGIAKPIAARLMGIALPGQILLTRGAHDLARRALGDGELHWRKHGRYRIKGLTDPLDVHEVGEAPIAPLRAPPGSAKAQRVDEAFRFGLAAAILIGVCAIAAALMYAR
jgi:class 3 adenylate cyclase